VSAELISPGFEPNLWWVDLRGVPEGLAQFVTAVFAILLLTFAFKPAMGKARRWMTLSVVVGFVLVTLVNSANFWHLLATGRVHSSVPVPASLFSAIGLSFLARGLSRGQPIHSGWLPVLAVGAACAVFFPVLQCVTFGESDYRRPAELAVVFGARTYANGMPSEALADRVRTACQLYREGLVKRLVFSGGPGDGATHETEAMRRLALCLGVPDQAILLDHDGRNTAATVQNTVATIGKGRVLAVSEFYHLPRIKLAYQRAGLEVYTVPAQPSRLGRALAPKSVLREVPAFWYYYLRAVVGRLSLGDVRRPRTVDVPSTATSEIFRRNRMPPILHARDHSGSIEEWLA
jgi:vancomycin permeability regulator SanA